MKANLNIYQEVEFNYTIYPNQGSNQVAAQKSNSISFQNLGTATVTIDKTIPIPPNGVITFSGNIGERITNVFNLTYSTGTQKVLVIRKQYRDE